MLIVARDYAIVCNSFFSTGLNFNRFAYRSPACRDLGLASNSACIPLARVHLSMVDDS